MARRPRLYLPDCPLHITQRGNNRDACFRDDSDYKTYLYLMREAVALYVVLIYAAISMPLNTLNYAALIYPKMNLSI
ncbi:transposase [Marinomonas profundimaris]|uniref:Transposase n=1 Tax=Marinomonas profundimaris TaxID=1208321 RepID=W1RZ46_9GAMM|nr:transposase [Marinomonas profundimaris]ETI62080.1 transposase [Marinomonas profundimaris]